MLQNNATEYPGMPSMQIKALYKLETHILMNNMASMEEEQYIANMSFLQIKNCTFKNNQVDRRLGEGGAIMSTFNNSLDLSHSIFDGNMAHLGGAIHQKTGKMKISQCSFFGNSMTAVTGLRSNISVMNSIFKDNLGKSKGGAVAVGDKSILNVSNTTFQNNEQLSGNLYPFHTEGGGAIYLSKSLGSISKSWFHNNSAGYNWGGSVFALNCSYISFRDTTFDNSVAGEYGGAMAIFNSLVNIESSNFKNNSAFNKAIGMGGGLYLDGNSTTRITNVLFLRCHARLDGAIASNSTRVIMSNSSVISNTGSAIFLYGGDSLEISNSVFLNNSTPRDGGAIKSIMYGVVKMVNTRFSQNKALNRGGALYIDTMSKLKAQNCTFTDNIAYQGAAINAHLFCVKHF